MEKISVSEFEDFCNKKTPTVIILHYENQVSSTLPSTFRASIIFDTISVRYNPNTIKLSSKCGSVFFDLVNHVYADEDLPIGRVFHIVCENIYTQFVNQVYTIVVR